MTEMPGQSAMPAGHINLAHVCRATHALGPGPRYAIWVQGCPLACPGCLAKQYRDPYAGQRVALADLIADILARPDLVGLTLSGGEPMAQAGACLALIRALRRRRPHLSLMVYTGYTLTALQRDAKPDQLGLLAMTDVLIDGPYRESDNDNRGLRGSTNQGIHLLSEVYQGLGVAWFIDRPRQIELYLERQALFMAGIPPQGMDHCH